jgi:hypothetical protein
MKPPPQLEPTATATLAEQAAELEPLFRQFNCHHKHFAEFHVKISK